MSIVHMISPDHRALALDIIRRNIATLTNLELGGLTPQPDIVATQQTLNQNYLEASLFIPCLPSLLPSGSSTMGSHLTSLLLRYVCLTREGFSALLRNLPQPRKLTLFSVPLLHHNPAIDLFKSSSVTHLNASLTAFWTPDSVNDLTAPSLLCHFPMLQEWHVRSVLRPPTWDDVNVRKELSKRCPHLTSFGFEHVDKAKDLPDLLLNCIRRPESLTFPSRNMGEKMALSLITHNITLTSITITYKCVVPTIMKWIYLIPMSCSRLQVFSVEDLVLDMALVLEHEWSCQNLSELHVRFKGLESAQAIDTFLKLISFVRRNPSSNCVNSSWMQIFNHLRQFNRLTTVSLGTKVYYLAAASA